MHGNSGSKAKQIHSSEVKYYLTFSFYNIKKEEKKILEEFKIDFFMTLTGSLDSDLEL